MRPILAGLILALWATSAAAGAWPRAQGEAFVTLGQTFTTGVKTLLAPTLDLDSWTALYVEYGATEKLTLGLDAARGSSPESSLYTGLVFARYPVWESDRGDRVAADLGIGWRTDSLGAQDTRLRAGLAWGRGFERRRGSGWVGIEAWMEELVPSHDQIYKADFTLGLKPDDRWMMILQVNTGLYPDADPLVRIFPSVVRKFGKYTHLELGFGASVLGQDAVGIKIATWFSF